MQIPQRYLRRAAAQVNVGPVTLVTVPAGYRAVLTGVRGSAAINSVVTVSSGTVAPLVFDIRAFPYQDGAGHTFVGDVGADVTVTTSNLNEISFSYYFERVSS